MYLMFLNLKIEFWIAINITFYIFEYIDKNDHKAKFEYKDLRLDLKNIGS